MNLANTIRMMAEKKDAPPFDVSKADYAGAAKELTQYAKTKGGMDKNDFLAFANRMSAIANKKAPRVTAKFARDLMDLDTSPREKIVSVMRDNGIKVTVQGGGFKIEDYTIEDLEQLEELDEAMVRGKEVFDKTFANRTQADNFAKKNGGRVKQVGRVFYVFKEANDEDEAPASPDEMSMAKTQLEFIEYAAEEIAEHIESGKRFPEWMQNKLSAAHEAIEGLHSSLGDHGEDEDEEEMDEARRDPSKSGGSGYDLYHKDFSSAMQHAYKYAKDKLGVEVDPKEIDDKVASGPRKPSKGKTNTYRLKGKDGKKAVQIQVANLDDKKFELNMYKESVELELDEAMRVLATKGKTKVVTKGDGVARVMVGNKEVASGDLDDGAGGWFMSKKGEKGQKFFDSAKKIADFYAEEVEIEEAYKTPTEASAYEAGKRAAREGKKYQDNPNKKGTAEFTAWSKGHNEARAKGMKEEVNLDELFESSFEEELAEAMYQVDIKGAGRETVMAKNEKDAIAKASKKMKVHSFKSSDVTVKLAEDIETGMYGLSKSLLDSVRGVVLGEAKKEALDPVGKEDDDVDNDGDTDSSDEYLKKRRKAVSKAIKKDKNDEDDGTEDKEPVGKSGKQMKVDTKPSLDEAEMSDAEMKKREEIVKSMKDKEQYFKDKYGDRWKEVMYATATKMAQKQA